MRYLIGFILSLMLCSSSMASVNVLNNGTNLGPAQDINFVGATVTGNAEVKTVTVTGGSGVSGVTAGFVPVADSTTSMIDSSIYQSGANIGINITNPSATLEVNGNLQVDGTIYSSGANSSVTFSNGATIDGTGSNLVLKNQKVEVDGSLYVLSSATLRTAGTNNNPRFLVKTSAGGSLASPNISAISASDFGGVIVMAQDSGAPIGTGKYLGQMVFTGSYTTDGALHNGGALIQAITTGTWNAADNPTKLVFETGDTGITYRLPRAQITATGTTIGTNNATISALLSVGDSAPTKNHVDGTNDLIVKDAIEADGNIYVDGSIYGYGTGLSNGRATCWYANRIGYCSDQPNASGVCTCN